jgi:polar amino acid transport system substrate-binding protein
MRNRCVGRRAALLGMTMGLIAPRLALAVRPSLTLATGALPPLTSAPGQSGFLDALAQEVFGRIGFDATVVRLPVERALINADAGIEDGDMFRAPGFEKDYPNLVQIPEKVLDFEFVAYATQADVQVREIGRAHV